MDTLEKLDLQLHISGASLKVLKITGKANVNMPLHHSTKEVALIIQEGNAKLSILGKEHSLKRGEVFVIPANEKHSLSLETDFEALAVMAKDSSIEFD